MNRAIISGCVSMLMLMAAALSGCSSSNDKAPGLSVTGQHSESWLLTTHPTLGTAPCQQCHGVDFSGGIAKVSCLPCHPGGPQEGLPRCTSCHGNPPIGAAKPNTEGAHGEHNLLAEVAGECRTCHNGFGSGTFSHFSGASNRQRIANVAILSTFNAESGAATYSATTKNCSNVSCHGGQVTPLWLGGALDVLNQCQSCHELANAVPVSPALPTPQFNSFFSGQHKFHVQNVGLACGACHDMDASQAGANQGALNHFRFLSTPVVEGPARATLRAALAFNGTPTPPTCNPPSTCHAVNPLRPWSQQVLP